MSYTLKNLLVECLTERKIRQSQLARRLRMSPAYVSRLCGGQIQPSIESALRIARYFGKPVEAIFQLVDSEPISPASLGSVGKQTNNPTETMKGK